MKSELEITKNAPQQVGRCELIKLESIIKNGGTGDVQGIQVTDQLDDGLVTIEGNDRLQFEDPVINGDQVSYAVRVCLLSSRTTKQRRDN